MANPLQVQEEPKRKKRKFQPKTDNTKHERSSDHDTSGTRESEAAVKETTKEEN